jgi:lipopolysaccharide export system protein LptA
MKAMTGIRLILTGAVLTRAIAAGAIAAVSLTAAAHAQQTPSDAPIRIESDANEVLQKEGRGVYSGHVVVTQGNSRITTDKLTLVCAKSAKTASGNQNCEEIDQIIAEGNVLYTAPDAKLKGDKAVYQYNAGIITITGADVIVTSGDDNVTRGTEAVYNVDGGAARITAGKERVTSIFTPKKKDRPAAPATPPN